MSQETAVLFSFSHVTVYSFNSALQTATAPIISPGGENECGFLELLLHLTPALGLSSVPEQCATREKGEGLQKYVKWLEWLLGTCEESP